MRIVCDSGPIIHLREAHALDLIRNCGSVLIPQTVLVETTSRGAPLPSWIGTQRVGAESLREVAILIQSAGLHRGEAECIVLAHRTQADWFITDDASARYCATNIGLEVHGSLGIVLYNAAMGLIERTRAKNVLKVIRQGSLYLSDHVFERAMNALDTMPGGSRHHE